MGGVYVVGVVCQTYRFLDFSRVYDIHHIVYRYAGLGNIGCYDDLTDTRRRSFKHLRNGSKYNHTPDHTHLLLGCSGHERVKRNDNVL